MLNASKQPNEQRNKMTAAIMRAARKKRDAAVKDSNTELPDDSTSINQSAIDYSMMDDQRTEQNTPAGNHSRAPKLSSFHADALRQSPKINYAQSERLHSNEDVDNDEKWLIH